MDVLELTFLGKPYELPKDLLAYISYHRKFENLRQSLLLSMLKWHGNNPKSVKFDPTKKHFQFVAQQCVSLLFEKGIYSKTEDDYLTDNEGLDHYDKSLCLAQIKRLDIEIAKAQGLLSAIDNAERTAKENVTGMGFSVYSSNIVALGVWAAMESSTVKKQAAEADRLYSEMVGSAISRGDDLASRQVAQLVKNYWLPNLKESIDVFIAIVFDRFIKHLIENGQFDERALDYLDSKRAEMIVKNVSVASDKIQLLREAFSKCPFSLSIYTEAIRLGEFTADECYVAKTFGLLDDIASDNKESAVRIARVMEVPESNIISQLTHHASIAALIHNISPEEAIANFLSLRRQSNIHKLEMLQTMDGKSRKFDQLMRDSVARKVTDIINIAESGQQLSDHFYNYINATVLLNDDSKFYDSYKERAVSALVTKADAYINEAWNLSVMPSSSNSSKRDFAGRIKPPYFLYAAATESGEYRIRFGYQNFAGMGQDFHIICPNESVLMHFLRSVMDIDKAPCFLRRFQIPKLIWGLNKKAPYAASNFERAAKEAERLLSMEESKFTVWDDSGFFRVRSRHG